MLLSPPASTVLSVNIAHEGAPSLAVLYYCTNIAYEGAPSFGILPKDFICAELLLLSYKEA